MASSTRWALMTAIFRLRARWLSRAVSRESGSPLQRWMMRRFPRNVVRMVLAFSIPSAGRRRITPHHPFSSFGNDENRRLSMNGVSLDIFDAIKTLQVSRRACVVARVGDEGIIIIHALGRFWARIQ